MLDLVRLDPQWRSFFDDGSTLDLVANTAADGREAFHFLAKHESCRRAIDASWLSPKECIASRTTIFFGSRSAVFATCLMCARRFSRGSSASPRYAAGTFGRGRCACPYSAIRALARWWIILRSMSDQPLRLPAVLCGIAHMQTREGVWYPMGGTGAIPEALAALGRVSRCRGPQQRAR